MYHLFWMLYTIQAEVQLLLSTILLWGEYSISHFWRGDSTHHRSVLLLDVEGCPEGMNKDASWMINHYSIYQKNEVNAIYLSVLHDCYSKMWLHLLDFFVFRWTKLVHQLWQLVHAPSVIVIKAVVQDVSDTLVGVVILPALTEMTWAFFICVIKITWCQIFVFWLCQVTGLQSQFLCKENWEKKVQCLLLKNINYPRQSFHY